MTSSLANAAVAGGQAGGQTGGQPAAKTGSLISTGGEPQQVAYASGMRETIETIDATVALARRQGAAQATIMLEPAELGAVRIHLSQTSEGLTARVSAETAAGAQAIASGHAELHSTLSSLGVALLRLDLAASSQQEGRAGGHAQRPTEPRERRSLASETDLEELHPAALATTVALSRESALIDVLA